jgi:hypothetical protein
LTALVEIANPRISPIGPTQGGDDAPDNLTAPCVDCHLDGIHGGAIDARGPASELRWTLGREPIVEVVGRQRRQLPR